MRDTEEMSRKMRGFKEMPPKTREFQEMPPKMNYFGKKRIFCQALSIFLRILI